ncbi:exocyst complex component EXO70B1 [Tanacetum coccineum]
MLKERFKSFNAMFDEIHRTQTTWVVSDEQLQSEIRVSISAIVIPAYRSFMGRFNQVLTPGRQTEKYIKYIKYQPEDIETCIEELFDGTTSQQSKKR